MRLHQIPQTEDHMQAGVNKGSVYIVEDDKLLALVTKRLLTQLGYSIAGVAKSALEAVDEVSSFDADVILMDISLNGDMDGIEAVRRIRKSSDIPVIFLSGSSDKETWRRAREVGMTDFLVKPICADDLVAPLKQAISESRMMQASRKRDRVG